MNILFRNILGVISGIVIGSVANMFIIMYSGKIIPPPAGADLTTQEGLIASLHLFEPKHFIMPFLAHALGTLIGSYTTLMLVKSKHLILSLVIGFWFLIGGIASVFLLPSPLWFSIIDLVFAYIPVSLLVYQFFKTTKS